jgi:hypothetical protein
LKYVALTFLPKNKEQLTALKAFAKAMKIDFMSAELTEREKAIALYGLQFVEEVEKGREDIKEGRTTTYTLDELETLCS